MQGNPGYGYGYGYDVAGNGGGGGYYPANDRYPAAAYEDPLADRRQPLAGLEFQPSDTCPRNYVIFDQTYDRSRVMYHPSLPADNFGGGYDHYCYGYDHQGYYPGESAYYHGGGGGGSVRQKEDTDEIDALMSTEDGGGGGDDDEDDVLSTGRTPGCRAAGSPDSTCSSGGGRKHEVPAGGEKKKERVKKMVRTLKGIIPGGHRMDTPAAVLDEAVRYLKSLKVEVNKAGARGSTS
jgi:hypothetical protein